MQQIAGHLLAQGEPQYVFSLRPIPTPGVSDTLLTLDAQKLHYYNQQETWQMLTWPSIDPQSAGTRLEWQTDTAGTNRSFEYSGRWALLRMLERATVEPVDSATYRLTWQAKPASVGSMPMTPLKADAPKGEWDEPDTATLTAQAPLVPAPSNVTHPLRYMIRTDVGKGPLELLALRGFVLPSRIFVERAAPAGRLPQSNGPPPLPKAAREAARHAEVPIPSSRGPS